MVNVRPLKWKCISTLHRNEVIRSGCKSQQGQSFVNATNMQTVTFISFQNWNRNDKNHSVFVFSWRLFFSVFHLIEQQHVKFEWDLYNGNANTAKVFVNYMQLGFAMDFSCLLHAVHFLCERARKEWQLFCFSRLKTAHSRKKKQAAQIRFTCRHFNTLTTLNEVCGCRQRRFLLKK